jgi:hypothetical protein
VGSLQIVENKGQGGDDVRTVVGLYSTDPPRTTKINTVNTANY